MLLTYISYYYPGDIEEFPALNPIPTYRAKIDQITNEVKITLSSQLMKQNNIFRPLCKSDDSNQDIVVIIGSGKNYCN